MSFDLVAADFVRSDPASPLNPELAFQGLTALQEDYCQARMRSLNMTEAYRLAYDTAGMSDSALWVTAWNLERHPKVTARLKQLLAQQAAQTSLIPKADRAFVMEGVTRIALQSDKDSVKLRAFELLGKSDGIDLFRETKVTTTKARTPEQIDEELRQYLARMPQVLEQVEATARDITPQAPAAKPDRRRKPKA